MGRLYYRLVGVCATLFLTCVASYADQLDRYTLELEQGRIGSDTERETISFIDDLQTVSPTERRQAVKRLQSYWGRDDIAQSSRQSLDRVLCRIAPFRVVDASDRDFQDRMQSRFEQLWSSYRAAPDKETYEAARMADCASFNVEGGYFDISRAAAPVMPFGSCEFADFTPSRRLGTLVSDLQPVLARGILDGGSFYAIRAEQLTAALSVAEALSLHREGQLAFEEVRIRIGNIGARLRSLPVDPVKRIGDPNDLAAGSVDDLLSLAAGNRNGWRFGNDLAYHAALYGLVGAKDPAEAAPHISWLNQLAASAPVLVHPALADAVEPWVKSDMTAAPDYRDPVRIDRLFPGLMDDPRRDCRRNRRQSIEISDLATGTLNCWTKADGAIATHQDLIAFDACLTEIESPVWWLQVGAYRDAKRARNALDRLGEDVEDFADISFEVIPPDTKSAFYRLRTTTSLTRRQVGRLADLAELAGFSQLIGRNEIF